MIHHNLIPSRLPKMCYSLLGERPVFLLLGFRFASARKFIYYSCCENSSNQSLPFIEI